MYFYVIINKISSFLLLKNKNEIESTIDHTLTLQFENPQKSKTIEVQEMQQFHLCFNNSEILHSYTKKATFNSQSNT